MAQDARTQLFMPPVPRPPLAHSFRLEVTAGPDLGRSFEVLSPSRIGTAPINEVTLSDNTVSRFHARVEVEDALAWVTDLSSTNGTFVQGVRVHRAVLEDGVQLRLGQSIFVVRAQGVRPVELTQADHFGELYGRSAPMRALFTVLARLAKSAAPVLIQGETGSGKELVARALHRQGPRAEQPFVVVDCGAVAPSLIESELFGHEKGAFTGAEQRREGAFARAGAGTLFLDEIGELPLSLQPKLLRALESGQFKPVGADQEKTAQARVISATHRDLSLWVNQGKFREDLYFRLAVVPLVVPPLRARDNDVLWVAQRFFERSYRAAGGAEPPPELSAATRALLLSQTWPGNVRELKNMVERAVALGDPEKIAQGYLEEGLRTPGFSRTEAGDEGELPLEEAKRRFERAYLLKLLARHEGRLEPAAAEAEIHPKSLARLLRRHGLRRDELAEDLTDTDQ